MWCVLLFSICATTGKAQKTPALSPKNQAPDPAWIKMMDDPNVNYNEAVKAFDAYWKNRTKPVEEDERFETGGEKEKEEALHRKRQRGLTKDDPAIKYVYEYKRFLHWEMEMEPFVQPDGHIKSMDTRINEWKQQRQLQERSLRDHQVKIDTARKDSAHHHQF